MVRIIDITNMEIKHDSAYTDEELMGVLVTDFKSKRYTGLPDQRDVGLKYGFRIDGISDKECFVKRYWKHASESMFDWYEASRGNWKIRKVDPTKHRYSKGHPDYRISYEHVRKQPLNDKSIKLELKYNQDNLRPAQMDWIFEHASDGEPVWIMLVNLPEDMNFRV